MIKFRGSIDIDGVLGLFVPSFIKNANELYNLNLKEEDIKEYDFRAMGLTTKQTEHILHTMIAKRDFRNMQLVDGAKKSVHGIAKQYDLMSVTARPVGAKEQTFNWFEEHFENIFDPIIFNGYESKHKHCLSHSCAFHIDDCPDHVNALDKTETMPILFTQNYNLNNKTKFTSNNNLDTIIDDYQKNNGWGTIRVYNWDDCEKFLTKYYENVLKLKD